jgi:hypothetical protein
MISLKKRFGLHEPSPERERALRERVRESAEKARETFRQDLAKKHKLDENRRQQMPRDKAFKKEVLRREEPDPKKAPPPLAAGKKVELDLGQAGKMDLVVEANKPPKKEKLAFRPQTLKGTLQQTRDVVMETSLLGAGWMKNLLTRWGKNLATSKCAGGLGQLTAKTLDLSRKIVDRSRSIVNGTEKPQNLLGLNPAES